MGGVSTLANVFLVIAYVIVAAVLLLIVSGSLITEQMTRSPSAGALVAGALTPYVLLSLGPFLAWGILRGLCEIHAAVLELPGRGSIPSQSSGPGASHGSPGTSSADTNAADGPSAIERTQPPVGAMFTVRSTCRLIGGNGVPDASIRGMPMVAGGQRVRIYSESLLAFAGGYVEVQLEHGEVGFLPLNRLKAE